jgi:hypothetical protein
VLGAQKRAQTQYEIRKLGESLEAAKSSYVGKPKYFPGRLLLFNFMDVYRDTSRAVPLYLGSRYSAAEVPDINRTKDVLRAMFGTRLIGNNLGAAQFVYWDGTGNVNGANGNPNGKYLLEGSNCLVFYLAGIINANGPQGFSANPVNPSNFATKEKMGPFYLFEAPRLVQISATTPGFYGYLDPYGDSGLGFIQGKSMPYAFFGQGSAAADTYIDYCPSLLTSLGTPLVHYNGMNPNSVQIISAGADRVFGVPGAWSVTAGTLDLRGRDDQSNFSSGQLAYGTN